MPKKSFRGLVKQAIVPYVGKQYGPLAANAANYLLSKPVSKAVSPAKVIANTKLVSYLDKKYQKKCGVEVKQVDATGAPTITTSLATYDSPYVGIAQGLTDSTRLGNSIEVKSYHIEATFHCGASSTAPTLVRVMVLKQGQMQLAALTGAAVLQDPTNIKSPLLMDKQRSFTVLKDFTFRLSAFSSYEKDTYYRWVYTYRPKSCHSIKWTQADTTGVIGNMLEGNLQIMVMYEQPTGAPSAPTTRFYSRSEWVDV